MSKLQINASFKTFGAFWEHGKEETKFTGSLSSRQGVVELNGVPEYKELDHKAMQAIFAEMNPAPDLQGVAAICGFTAMNHRCTLLNPLRLRNDGLAHFPTMQKLDRARYQAMRTVIGLCIESSEVDSLDNAAYYFTKIHHLFPSPWRPELIDGETKRVINNHTTDIFRFRSEALAAEVVCEVFAEENNSPQKSIVIKSVPRIRITPDNRQSVDWFARLAFRLENFFSLILGTSVEIENVQLFQGNEHGWLIQKVNGNKEKVDPQTWVRCKFEDTARALNNWLSIPKEDQLVELTFLGSLRKSKLFQETEFLTLVQSLEGFGRIRFGGTKRRQIKLDTSIKNIYDLFTHETARQLVGKCEDFKLQVIQTRDYYTHLGNRQGTSVAKSMKELFLLNKQLYAFLRGAMLINSGIGEEFFSQALVYQATRWI